MGAYENYMNFLLEKVSVIGYKYLSKDEKDNLERISKDEDVRIPISYLSKSNLTPKPTPIKPSDSDI